MPPYPPSSRADARQRRHQHILHLIGQHFVRSQGELCELLEETGYEVNQGTLSRDLRELGVIKGPDGYELPPNAGANSDSHAAQLVAATKLWLTVAIVAQNQIVLKTPAGGAQPLALSIDRANLDLAIGTLAGDDTVLVICADQRNARRLAAQFEGMR